MATEYIVYSSTKTRGKVHELAAALENGKKYRIARCLAFEVPELLHTKFKVEASRRKISKNIEEDAPFLAEPNLPDHLKFPD